MNEIFRQNILLGNYTLKKKLILIFSSQTKRNKTKNIDNWKNITLYKLEKGYKVYLKEAGLLDKNNKENKITPPFINPKFKNLLEKNNLQPYLKAITGKKLILSY